MGNHGHGLQQSVTARWPPARRRRADRLPVAAATDPVTLSCALHCLLERQGALTSFGSGAIAGDERERVRSRVVADLPSPSPLPPLIDLRETLATVVGVAFDAQHSLLPACVTVDPGSHDNAQESRAPSQCPGAAGIAHAVTHDGIRTPCLAGVAVVADPRPARTTTRQHRNHAAAPNAVLCSHIKHAGCRCGSRTIDLVQDPTTCQWLRSQGGAPVRRNLDPLRARMRRRTRATSAE